MRAKPSKIVLECKRTGDVYLVASNLGIHPTTVYRWIKRATVRPGVISSNNLKRKSTRPKIIHKYEFTLNQKLRIQSLRNDKGWMAKKIVKHNENALIERSFRTDEEEFFFRLTKQSQNYD